MGSGGSNGERGEEVAEQERSGGAGSGRERGVEEWKGGERGSGAGPGAGARSGGAERGSGAGERNVCACWHSWGVSRSLVSLQHLFSAFVRSAIGG